MMDKLVVQGQPPSHSSQLHPQHLGAAPGNFHQLYFQLQLVLSKMPFPKSGQVVIFARGLC